MYDSSPPPFSLSLPLQRKLCRVEQSKVEACKQSELKRESLSKKSPSFVLCFLSPHSSLLALPSLLRQVQLVLGLSAGLLFMPAAIALFIPLCALPVALFITSKKCH